MAEAEVLQLSSREEKLACVFAVCDVDKRSGICDAMPRCSHDTVVLAVAGWMRRDSFGSPQLGARFKGRSARGGGRGGRGAGGPRVAPRERRWPAQNTFYC